MSSWNIQRTSELYAVSAITDAVLRSERLFEYTGLLESNVFTKTSLQKQITEMKIAFDVQIAAKYAGTQSVENKLSQTNVIKAM